MPKRNWYVAKSGPLKGRRFASRSNYNKARDEYENRSIVRQERYGQLLQVFIEQKGEKYAKQNMKEFRSLYKAAAKKGFEEAPATNREGKQGNKKRAPYAYLLDLIGVRPLDEFGWRSIGDTP